MKKKDIEFKIGEIVVYPKHGVGEIIKIENMEIASIKTKFYVVKMEQSKLTIRVPIEKQNEVGLRKISSKKIRRQSFPALSVNPVDVSGAGDALLALMATSLCSNNNLMLAASLGSCMSAIAVEIMGNRPINSLSLKKLVTKIFETERSRDHTENILIKNKKSFKKNLKYHHSMN